MSTVQPGIFAENTAHHRFLRFDLNAGPDRAVMVRAVHDAGVALNGFMSVHSVIAFGPQAAQILEIDVPADFGPMPPIGSMDRRPVAEQGAALLWIHGDDIGDVVDAALAARRAFAVGWSYVDDVAGFVYRDSRDLTGFIDGTENPGIQDALKVAVIGDGEPGAGGSVLFSQRWVHDLDAFHALPLASQEATFGRTKDDSTEFESLADDAHIERVQMDDESGEEIEIYRRSVPFIRGIESGLQFIAFTDSQPKIVDMLHRMFGSSADGGHDRLVDFTAAVSTAFYFAPCIEALPVSEPPNTTN